MSAEEGVPISVEHVITRYIFLFQKDIKKGIKMRQPLTAMASLAGALTLQSEAHLERSAKELFAGLGNLIQAPQLATQFISESA